jgi:thiamine biosynthesis lipoprotein
MKQTKIIMGMPITIEVVDDINSDQIDSIFKSFIEVDERFSTYKTTSEISKINEGLSKKFWSNDMKKVMSLCEQTKKATKGYFDIRHKDKFDPSGLVKGWSIQNAAKLLVEIGKTNFYIEAGGDIQVSGNNTDGKDWVIGIRNPFNIDEIIKVLKTTNKGIASSGTYIRGQHIYNPLNSDHEIKSVQSLTVIGPNIYEADRFATAGFAMGEAGINFIEETPGLEGYMVNADMVATYTSGFERFVVDYV